MMTTNKTIGVDELESRLMSLWPECEAKLFDRLYTLVDEIWLKKYLATDTLNTAQFMRHHRDCDNFALFLHAKLKMLYAQEDWAHGELAFGEVMGYLAGGLPHAMNLAVTDKTILLIEPQTVEIREATKEDRPFFIRM